MRKENGSALCTLLWTSLQPNSVYWDLVGLDVGEVNHKVTC